MSANLEQSDFVVKLVENLGRTLGEIKDRLDVLVDLNQKLLQTQKDLLQSIADIGGKGC